MELSAAGRRSSAMGVVSTAVLAWGGELQRAFRVSGSHLLFLYCPLVRDSERTKRFALVREFWRPAKGANLFGPLFAGGTSRSKAVELVRESDRSGNTVLADRRRPSQERFPEWHDTRIEAGAIAEGAFPSAWALGAPPRVAGRTGAHVFPVALPAGTRDREFARMHHPD